MDRKELEKLSRAELVEKAEAAGVTRPRTLTMPELIDEILLASERATGQKKPRGWFGRARDLLTSVVDRGLSSDPRKPPPRSQMPAAPPPLPTVTLAEIYAAQGHLERAIATLDEVIARDAGHDEAKKLRERFADQLRRQRPSRPPPEGMTASSLTPELAQDAPKEDAPPAGTTGLTAEALTPEIQPDARSVAAPVTAADEAPPPAPEATPELADRYDVDEVVAIAVDPHTVYTYWEVRAATLAPLRNTDPDGALTLRVLTVSAAEGASSDARDVRVDAAIGELFIHDLPANAEIRVAIGWLAKGTFQPVAVGLELATPREAPASEVAVRFGRLATGGIGEPYDALRAGGLVGHRGTPTFQRATPEEVSLGHAPAMDPLDRFASVGVERDFSETVERTETPEGTAEILTRVETRRLGASDLLTRESVERRFVGASENLRASAFGPTGTRGRPGDVSFRARPSAR